MFRKESSIDIVDKILDACYRHNPDALFIMSLMHQYEERGSLSKKQLQGLYQKAAKVKDLPANWLATLEAIITKMPNRFKSEPVSMAPAAAKDNGVADKIAAILAKYPQHKRVLFLQLTYETNHGLTPAEIGEVEKFAKLLL